MTSAGTLRPSGRCGTRGSTSSAPSTCATWSAPPTRYARSPDSPRQPRCPTRPSRQADEIRFLDNSPEALRKRLGHGNIYPPGQAREALDGLFQTATLAALREIGLRVIAETLTAPGSARQREPLDVLVAVTAPAQAETLIRRGARLARRGNARCTVLTLGPPAGTPGDWTAAVQTLAQDAGAAVIAREGRDTVAAIAQAVRETGARHLVIAAPPAGLIDRWRPGQVERLASQLPDVHLHITAGQARPSGAAPDGGDSPDRAPGAAGRQPHATVRVYLGYAPGCGITSAMLGEAGRRRSRGADVVVATVDCRGRESVSAALEGLEMIGDGTSLDTAAVLARHPEVACIDDLSTADPGGESRFAAARQLADAGITIVATVRLGSLQDGDGAAGDTLDEAAVLALADEIELVDAPPSALADRVKRDEIVPAGGAEHALQAEYSPETLGAQREQAFTIVAEHAERRLAAYRGSGASGGETHPRILGCAAPRPGMEPLIRRSAALAGQLAGDLLVAVVTRVPAAAGLDQVLAGYAALASQLGGQFTVLQGRPADALARFAHQHQVTEIAAGPRRRAPAATAS